MASFELKKVKDLVKWEFETNSNRAIQKIYYPPRPKRVLPFFSKELKEDPKLMAASADSAFLGMQTGFLIHFFLLLTIQMK